MKNVKQILVLALMAVALVNCSADEEQPVTLPPLVFQNENPYADFINTAGFTTVYVYTDDNNYYEIGYKFTPLVKGEINAVFVKIPAVVSDVRLTIWDVASGTPIRTEYVDVAEPSTKTTLAIAPLPLEKNKEYAVSINTRDYYFRYSPTGAYQNFPVVVNHLSISGAFSNMGTAQENVDFTTIVNGAFGDCSISFKQTL